MHLIAVEKLITDERFCARENGVNREHVDDLAAAYRAGDELPPLVVYCVAGDYYVVAGWHRLAAAKIAGRAEVACVVTDGTVAEAKLAAAGSNLDAALKRTNGDKRRQVRLALEAHPEWTDSAIGRHVRVDDQTVKSIRADLEAAGEVAPKPERVDARGHVRKAPAAPKPKPKPAKPPKPEPAEDDEFAGPAYSLDDEPRAKPVAPPEPDLPVERDAAGTPIPAHLADTFGDPEPAAVRASFLAVFHAAGAARKALAAFRRKSQFFPHVPFADLDAKLDRAEAIASQLPGDLDGGLPHLVDPAAAGGYRPKGGG